MENDSGSSSNGELSQTIGPFTVGTTGSGGRSEGYAGIGPDERSEQQHRDSRSAITLATPWIDVTAIDHEFDHLRNYTCMPSKCGEVYWVYSATVTALGHVVH